MVSEGAGRRHGAGGRGEIGRETADCGVCGVWCGVFVFVFVCVCVVWCVCFCVCLCVCVCVRARALRLRA